MYNSIAADSVRTNRARLIALAVLTLGEVVSTSYAFNFPTGYPEWANPVFYAKAIAQAGLLATVVFLLVIWPQRSAIVAAWSDAARRQGWYVSLLANLALFAALLAATIAFSSLAASATEPPWGWFALYCALLLATGASLAAIAAPLSFWRWLVRSVPTQIAVTLVGACLVVLAGRLTLESWSTLSTATLVVSHGVLALYESDVHLDLSRQLLGAGGFNVLVLRECSGYEGIGLVTAFLALYCWLMRGRLRFPNAFLLFPLAIATVWLLNAVRIALLISVGRHLSPDIALNGFHSQAGWIGFLAVAIGAMTAGNRMPFFSSVRRRTARREAKADDELLLALLMPFVALMAASILESLFAPHDQWLYLVKVLAVGATLFYFRHVYATFPWQISPLSVATGISVGILWIATDANQGGALAAWLASLPVWAAAAWMVCRAFGAVVLVPIAEELAFRSYLQRLLVARDFSQVAPGHFTWISFVVTSLSFGLMHERWIMGAIAGAIYALLVYRTNRLSDAIAAHASSNFVIVAWAIGAQQWSLL